MDSENLKKMHLTPIEDLITEDFGAIGSPEREQFDIECDAFIIGERIKDETRTWYPVLPGPLMEPRRYNT